MWKQTKHTMGVSIEIRWNKKKIKFKYIDIGKHGRQTHTERHDQQRKFFHANIFYSISGRPIEKLLNIHLFLHIFFTFFFFEKTTTWIHILS